ncbi:MAG: glycosyltransferase family 4 protein [Actinobacteria bacterium]|nr:glycosyltransferase family 4 protein [Actinomycetota bacterium]
MGKGRIAFVPPRYGDDVVGGAETVLRQAGERLAGRGWEVEILTTCARDHYSWANAYPAGSSRQGDLTVRRFPIVHAHDPVRWDGLERRIRIGGGLSADEQFEWMNGRFRVPGLFHHLVGHAHTYRAIVFSPYLFWTTVVGATVAPERTVLIPCLHDENYAYLSMFQPLLGGSAQVWFMSEPEHQLAHRIGPVAPQHFVTGEGVLIPDRYDPEGFRARHGLERPYVLFAGRREDGKGWNDLLRGYSRAVVRLGADVDLVSFGVSPAGVAPPKLPAEVASRVIDLGFLPQEEVGDAYAAAAAYVQPSLYESFSRTIMESWLAHTPVIANSACEVVRWHCERSGGGLLYSDEYELAQYLALVAGEPAKLAHLADAGRRYVLENYSWDAALDRMEAALEELL